MIFERQLYRAGIYLRLSKDDDLQGESASISTQRTILNQYCAEHNFHIVEEYCDDGWSGMNFERPNFQRMIEDIKSERITLVIVKDLSRFGREHNEMGIYIDKVFALHNTRFIAVTDNVDTLRDDNFFVSVKSVINGEYSKDISRKTRAAFDAKAKDGQYIASKPPYGYEKSPDDKHKLVVDEEAAEIVRKIFTLASEGCGYNKIARELEGTPNPITHFMLNNPDYYKKQRWKHSTTWNNRSLRVIFDNETYLGKVIHGKTRTIIVGGNVQRRRPQKEWIVVEDTHEPIISQDLWDKAHAALAVRRKETSTKEPHIFAGVIKCADCGASLQYNGGKSKKSGNGEFRCYKYSSRGKGFCTTHHITYNRIYNVVLDAIRNLSKKACMDEEKFIKNLEKESRLTHEKHTKKSAAEREKLEERIDFLDRAIKKLYEDSVLGVISSSRFETLINGYEAEQTDLKAKHAEYKKLQTEQDLSHSQLDLFIGIIKEAKDLPALDASIVRKTVSKIEVGQAELNPENGRKEQFIRITYKFSPFIQDMLINP